MTTSPQIRPCEPGDEPGMVGLFRQACGQIITHDHWRWKLRGVKSTLDTAWLATAEGTPVFHYGGVPLRLSAAGRQITGVLAVDAMTAPAYRRRGLLSRAVQRIHSSWRDQGAAFVIGLPNDQWGSRVRALGWQTLFPLQWMVRPLRPEALLARRLRLPILQRCSFAGRWWNRRHQSLLEHGADLQTEAVRCADVSFDHLWAAIGSDSEFSTVRDRAWVQWRFLASPSRRYVVTAARRGARTVGYAAHAVLDKPGRRSAVLADLFAGREDRAARNALLHDVIEALSHSGAESLSTLAVPGTADSAWLRRAGFLPRQSFSVEIVPLSTELPLHRMRDAAHWNLSGADFDVV